MRRVIPLVLALLGCGPPVSLDDPEAGSSSTSTGAGPFGELTTFADDATLDPSADAPRQDLGGKLDVGKDVPLPPGTCDPDCSVELTPRWTYDGPAGGSSVPLDPEDQVAVIVEPRGTIVVAEERQGALELARLHAESGQEQWTLPLSLPCDPCRLVDLALHPSGDLLVAGYGIDATGAPAAVAARVELGAPSLVWATVTALVVGPGVAPRAGSLVAYDGDLLLQPVLEGSPTNTSERLELFAYDGATGGLSYAESLATGTGSSDAPAPRAAFDAAGRLVVTQPTWGGDSNIDGTLRWLAPASGELLGSAPLDEPSLRLAAASDGRVVALGLAAGRRESLLYLDSGTLRTPEQWELVHVLPTVTSSTPALAMDDDGHAYALARTAVGRPGHERGVALEVLRWTDDGLLVWKVSLPLPLDRVDEPVALALGPANELVIAGFLAGARHVERRVASCACG